MTRRLTANEERAFAAYRAAKISVPEWERRLREGYNHFPYHVVGTRYHQFLNMLRHPQYGGAGSRDATEQEMTALALVYGAAITVEEWERRVTFGWHNVPFKTTATNYHKALIALISSAPSVPAPAPGPDDHFPTIISPTRGHNGLYYYNANISEAITFARRWGLWVAILVNETDLTPYRENGRRSKADIFAERDAIKAAGLTAVATGWAEPFGDLDAQAAMIGEMAQGFDEYMLNIEAGWVLEAGGAAFAKSGEFAPKVRRALGNKPLTLCPDWGNNIWWRPWLEAGASKISYQCYLNQWPHKNPKRAVTDLLDRAQHDLPGGIPRTIERAVTYGRYGDGSTNVPLVNWTSQDDEAGKPPRSCWASEFNSAPDAEWLAR